MLVQLEDAVCEGRAVCVAVIDVVLVAEVDMTLESLEDDETEGDVDNDTEIEIVEEAVLVKDPVIDADEEELIELDLQEPKLNTTKKAVKIGDLPFEKRGDPPVTTITGKRITRISRRLGSSKKRCNLREKSCGPV